MVSKLKSLTLYDGSPRRKSALAEVLQHIPRYEKITG